MFERILDQPIGPRVRVGQVACGFVTLISATVVSRAYSLLTPGTIDLANA